MNLSQEKLLLIIKTQTEISKLGLDLSTVMTFVCQQAQVLTRAIGAVVELAEDEDMVYRAATGATEKFLGLRLKRASSLSGLCIERNEILICQDAETDPRVDREACRKVGVKSMVVAPLKYQDTVVGVLKVFSDQERAFINEDMEALGLLSELIAAAMHHSTEYESDKIFHQATHDGLTDLANRALFYDRLRHCVTQASRNAQIMAILVFDMDGLKQMNDQYGHRSGDAAIKEFGVRLRSSARESDTVARLGGDEFGIILSKINKKEEIPLIIGRVQAAMANSFAFEAHSLGLETSVGSSVFPDDGATIDLLIEKADQSMYQNKRSRRSSRGGNPR